MPCERKHTSWSLFWCLLAYVWRSTRRKPFVLERKTSKRTLGARRESCDLAWLRCAPSLCRFATLVSRQVCPLLLHLLKDRLAFPLAVRVLRTVATLLRDFGRSLVDQCEPVSS